MADVTPEEQAKDEARIKELMHSMNFKDDDAVGKFFAGFILFIEKLFSGIGWSMVDSAPNEKIQSGISDALQTAGVPSEISNKLAPHAREILGVLREKSDLSAWDLIGGKLDGAKVKAALLTENVMQGLFDKPDIGAALLSIIPPEHARLRDELIEKYKANKEGFMKAANFKGLAEGLRTLSATGEEANKKVNELFFENIVKPTAKELGVPLMNLGEFQKLLSDPKQLKEFLDKQASEQKPPLTVPHDKIDYEFIAKHSKEITTVFGEKGLQYLLDGNGQALASVADLPSLIKDPKSEALLKIIVENARNGDDVESALSTIIKGVDYNKIKEEKLKTATAALSGTEEEKAAGLAKARLDIDKEVALMKARTDIAAEAIITKAETASDPDKTKSNFDRWGQLSPAALRGLLTGFLDKNNKGKDILTDDQAAEIFSAVNDSNMDTKPIREAAEPIIYDKVTQEVVKKAKKNNKVLDPDSTLGKGAIALAYEAALATGDIQSADDVAKTPIGEQGWMDQQIGEFVTPIIEGLKQPSGNAPAK